MLKIKQCEGSGAVARDKVSVKCFLICKGMIALCLQ